MISYKADGYKFRDERDFKAYLYDRDDGDRWGPLDPSNYGGVEIESSESQNSKLNYQAYGDKYDRYSNYLKHRHKRYITTIELDIFAPNKHKTNSDFYEYMSEVSKFLEDTEGCTSYHQYYMKKRGFSKW